MRHQAAIELKQQVVGQPGVDIGPLRPLQQRVTLGLFAEVAPTRECALAFVLQKRCVDLRLSRPSAKPPGSQRPAITAIAGEQLVATLAG